MKTCTHFENIIYYWISWTEYYCRITRTYRRKSKRCTLSCQLNEWLFVRSSSIRKASILLRKISTCQRQLFCAMWENMGMGRLKTSTYVQGTPNLARYSAMSKSWTCQVYYRINKHIFWPYTSRSPKVIIWMCISFKVDVPEAWQHNKQAGSDWFSSFLKILSSLLIRVPIAQALTERRASIRRMLSSCIQNQLM